mgnify:CR=1 FL=1
MCIRDSFIDHINLNILAFLSFIVLSPGKPLNLPDFKSLSNSCAEPPIFDLGLFGFVFSFSALVWPHPGGATSLNAFIILRRCYSLTWHYFYFTSRFWFDWLRSLFGSLMVSLCRFQFSFRCNVTSFLFN